MPRISSGSVCTFHDIIAIILTLINFTIYRVIGSGNHNLTGYTLVTKNQYNLFLN